MLSQNKLECLYRTSFTFVGKELNKWFGHLGAFNDGQNTLAYISNSLREWGGESEGD
jgi:hypothetical protein